MMRALYALVLLFATHDSIFLRAQAIERPKPKFTLRIFDDSICGTNSVCYRGLLVVETNTSMEPIVEVGCPELQGVFSLFVLYEGHPLAAQHRAKARRNRIGDVKSDFVCLAYNEVDPGQSFTSHLGIGWNYPMTEPGTYEFTVSRESDPEHPDQSVTVKSNTLTIVVPESKQTDTK
jgi:hypothetical protein